MKKEKSNIFQSNWQNFWEARKNKDTMSFWMGALFTLISGVLIGYIGTSRVNYANQFHSVIFSMDYLEDIKVGTKIRYQGALVIGEVEKIESSLDGHKIFAKIKRDFKIPRIGSVISLQTWGYFGGKFIDIQILENYRDFEAYREDELVPISPVKNSTIAMNEFFNVLKKSEKGEQSILEKKLNSLASLTSSLKNSKFSRPRYMKYKIQSMAKVINKYNKKILKISNEALQKTLAANSKFDKKKIQKKMSTTFQDVLAWYKNIKYNESKVKSLFTKLLHEETTYYEALEYTKRIKKELGVIKKAPYKIIY